MLKIVRIVGESIDLTTGAQLPNGIVVSNGEEEITLPITDEDTVRVLRLSKLQLSEAPAPVPPTHTDPKEHPVDMFSLGEGPSSMYNDPATGTSSL